MRRCVENSRFRVINIIKAFAQPTHRLRAHIGVQRPLLSYSS
jgi:hypothetical protein